MYLIVESSKFARKMVQVPTLSALAQLVPYRQLFIPDPVYEYALLFSIRVCFDTSSNALRRFNLKFESSITIPDPPVSSLQASQRFFGRSLLSTMGPGAEHGIPRPIQICIDFLRQHGVLIK
jgi:hypothetical protein